MSHFSFTQRSGCSEILELLDISNLIALNDTVASKKKAWTTHEAISVILSHSQSAEELLKRRKITRESILKYLTEHGVTVTTSSSKQELINDVLHYWSKPDWNIKQLTPEKDLQVLGRKLTEGEVQKSVKDAAKQKLTSLGPNEEEQANKSKEQTDAPILKQMKMNINPVFYEAPKATFLTSIGIPPLATSSHLLPFLRAAVTARSVNPLVHSSLPTQTISSPGTFPCDRRICNTCRFTSSLDFIQGPKQSVQVQQRFTCTSSNLIYCIRCIRCRLLYIGETKRRLGDRFAEHLHSVRKKQPDLPVAQHFNSPSHSESDLSVLGLLHCHSCFQRKGEEQQLILYLGSLHPSGMNIDMSHF